ncbi:MAG: S-adenosylmethionine decarboxylase [Negativicutes bacterium]|jgi:S-adenosylmethionine decarboxylase
MKTPIARHLVMDLYNCKNIDLGNEKELIAAVESVAALMNNEEFKAKSFSNGECTHVLATLGCVYVSIHSYSELKFAAIDIYTATENADLTPVRNLLRKAFKPEKIKITNLKRGDFGEQKDMKPKSRTRVATGRRVKEAGGKLAKYIKKETKKIKTSMKRKPSEEN